MADREQAREIEDTAIDWAAKTTRGLSDSEQLELDRWLEGDPRRLGAFVRAQGAWIHSERATALGPMTEALEKCGEDPVDPPRLGKRQLNRRILLAGAGALAASVAGGLFMLDRPRTIDSGIGEILRLTLTGGSTLTLDTDTRVKITQGSGDRILELVSGKVFLTVVRANRPLMLSVGRLAMHMAEGEFGLESLGEAPLAAFVTKGHLAVSQSGGLWGRTRAISLAANRMLRLLNGADLEMARVRSINPAEVDALLAWRDGMLSFSGETLATAVRAFDRYGPIRIVIADPQLAEQEITGLFKANDPKGFATTVASSFGAAVASDGDVLRIVTKN
jgi:transmembrane sensor